MTVSPNPIDRPQRWQEPFGDSMRESDVDRLLQIEPFCSMDPAGFSRPVPLRGILANDCRIVRYEAGDFVLRQGEYGNSAFLLLGGTLNVMVGAQPESIAAAQPADAPVGGALGRLFSLLRLDRALPPAGTGETAAATRAAPNGPRMFLQNLPAVLARGETQTIEAGSIFGELAAINRAPHSATIVAGTSAEVLEIRWQGLRDLMQRDPALRDHIHRLYRERSLETHLRETPLLGSLPAEQLAGIAGLVEFESYGSMTWTQSWKSTIRADIAERILAEPVIAKQGEYCDSLILVRNGFARVTRTRGHGEQTIEYLGRGRVFGLRELSHNFRTREQRPWQLTLRATGYVDILRIPADVVNRLILSQLAPARLPPPLPPAAPAAGESRAPSATGGSTPSAGQGGTASRRLGGQRNSLPTPLLETVVEQRLMNGTEAMVIDLNRCTRCDDCVRACASTHGGTPRFVRSGTIHDNLLFAHACMHCADPVCMIGCPTGAIHRDAGTGLVAIQEATCIGCGSCAAACPYSNIQMVAVTDRTGRPLVDRENGLPVLKATKCDLCMDSGSGPACQRACPHDALVRIDLSTSASIQEWTRG